MCLQCCEPQLEAETEVRVAIDPCMSPSAEGSDHLILRPRCLKRASRSSGAMLNTFTAQNRSSVLTFLRSENASVILSLSKDRRKEPGETSSGSLLSGYLGEDAIADSLECAWYMCAPGTERRTSRSAASFSGLMT